MYHEMSIQNKKKIPILIINQGESGDDSPTFNLTTFLLRKKLCSEKSGSEKEIILNGWSKIQKIFICFISCFRAIWSILRDLYFWLIFYIVHFSKICIFGTPKMLSPECFLECWCERSECARTLFVRGRT